MITLDLPPSVDEARARLLLAIALFQEDELTLGRAAELAGLSYRAFAELLMDKGVPLTTYTEEMLRGFRLCSAAARQTGLVNTLVVTDTPRLIALDRIGHLGLLPTLFTVLAPPAVVAEFGRLPEWLAVRSAPLPEVLDRGESEAIGLALSIPDSELH